MIFNCTSNCGLCCRHVVVHPDVPATNGICDKLDRNTNKCTCYETRPLICRVVDCYTEMYAGKMSEEDYLAANYAACKRLQEEFGND